MVNRQNPPRPLSSPRQPSSSTRFQRAASQPSEAEAAAKSLVRRPGRGRRSTAQARRGSILAAALTVFASHGFAAARLDEVAARAGVAKGTLYLYFRDKEALFEALVRDAAAPLLEHMRKETAAPDISPLAALDTFFALFKKEVLGTERKLLLRLIVAEGPRFPAIAEFYYREVVAHGLHMLRALAERAAREGVFASDAPARFPQLIVAPLLVAVLWDGLFARIDPLDVDALLRAHRQVLTGKPGNDAP